MFIVVQVHDMFFSSSFLTKNENIKIFKIKIGYDLKLLSF
jgi:hypothetical protein